jgi:hypothetical protein
MALGFPSSPTVGQIFSGFVYTTTGWQRAPIATALPKNYIVNPTMSISQENASTSGGGVSGYYQADQWAYYFVGAPTNKACQRVFTAGIFLPQGSQYSLAINADNGP